MNKGIMIFVVLSVLSLFTGCTKDEPEYIKINKTLTQYSMVVNEEVDSDRIPHLTLFSDGTFGFTYDAMSSYYAHGTYEVEGNKLLLNTDDGRYKYTFNCNEDKEYIFVAAESSDVTVINREFGIQIEDGAVFKLDESNETKRLYRIIMDKE